MLYIHIYIGKNRQILQTNLLNITPKFLLTNKKESATIDVSFIFPNAFERKIVAVRRTYRELSFGARQKYRVR